MYRGDLHSSRIHRRRYKLQVRLVYHSITMAGEERVKTVINYRIISCMSLQYNCYESNLQFLFTNIETLQVQQQVDTIGYGASHT